MSAISLLNAFTSSYPTELFFTVIWASLPVKSASPTTILPPWIFSFIWFLSYTEFDNFPSTYTLSIPFASRTTLIEWGFPSLTFPTTLKVVDVGTYSSVPNVPWAFSSTVVTVSLELTERSFTLNTTYPSSSIETDTSFPNFTKFTFVASVSTPKLTLKSSIPLSCLSVSTVYALLIPPNQIVSWLAL